MNNRYFGKILASTEKRYEAFAPSLCASGENIGACITEFDIPYPRLTAECIGCMVSLYVTKDSKYYKSEVIKGQIERGLIYMRSSLSEYGLWDLYDCNFDSTPDTGFTTYPLMMSILMIKKCGLLTELVGDLSSITCAALNGMKRCGFHTPNHRWVIASSMMLGYRLFGDESYKKTAERFLAEGIDNTEFGEYAERSAGIYNLVNNRAMIYLADCFLDEGYYLYPTRNLKMMTTYFDPDGHVFTNNSTRQDRGKRVLPTEYFVQYLYLGHKLNNKEFLAEANYIFSLCDENGAEYPDALYDFILCDELSKDNDYEIALPRKYDVLYPSSNIARFMDTDYSFTLMAKSSTFLYFQSGSLVMSAKIGVAVCEHRHMLADCITEEDGKMCMSQKMQSWYYLPFDKPCGTSDWWAMPNASREKWFNNALLHSVKIEKIENGIEVSYDTSGIKGAPVKIEFAFDAGGDLRFDGNMLDTENGKYYVAKRGDVEYTKGADKIVVSDAFYAHTLVQGKFNTESQNSRLVNVYFTAMSPFSHKFRITKG